MSSPVQPSPRTATAVGCLAIMLWASLATLASVASAVPPFELTAVTFALGGGLGLIVALARGAGHRLWPSLPVLGLGVAGLFGDYVLYFAAVRFAPPSQVALIVALWPLLMVGFAAVLLGETLRLNHVVGVLVGLAGVLVSTAGATAASRFEAAHALGYALAFGAAVVWAGYSVLSRRHRSVPTETVASFCLVGAGLALACHLAWERTVIPSGAGQFAAVAALGLGPVGGSFFAWDYAVKHGNIRVLGTLSYAVPVLSTLLLVAFGLARPEPSLAVACALVVLAALVAVAPSPETRTAWRKLREGVRSGTWTTAGRTPRLGSARPRWPDISPSERS